ncbi:MAG: exodeoxyribonuclease VII small subunit [Deltaproteobacteria bacterium]|nr:MAG: exodeoxyribonuclease VII small subunit [Deltaproteobacteria bacterium]
MSRKTFEEAITQLEGIVAELESGDLPLEKALKKFEEGMKIKQFCQEKLSAVEQKISVMLAETDGTLTETPVDQEPLSSPEDTE